MDDLVRDPELAPQLFAVVNNNLQDTRRALEAMKQDNDNLRAELERLQAAQIVLKVEQATLEELQNAKRQLDEALETNQQLRGENSDLRSILAGWKGSDQEEVGPSQGQAQAEAGCPNCDEARGSIERLNAELDEARDALRQHARAYDELHERLDELLEQEQQGTAARGEQDNLIGTLRGQIAIGNTEVDALKRRVQELETQLKRRDEELQAKDGKLAEAEQRYNSKVMDSDHQLYKLRQDLELTTQKYWRYKAGFDQLNTRQTQATPATSAAVPPPPAPATAPPLPPPAASPPPPPATLHAPPPPPTTSSPSLTAVSSLVVLPPLIYKPSAASRSLVTASSNLAPAAIPQTPPAPAIMESAPQAVPVASSSKVASASTAGSPQKTPAPAILTGRPGSANSSNMTAIRQKFLWANLINTALTNHCLSISTPNAPSILPAEVKKHFTPGSSVLSCPNRIIAPSSENHIQLLAPVAHCKSAKETVEFGPPTDVLASMIGCAREVFYHGTSGISYLGTYIGVSVSELTAQEYANLPKPTKEALVKETFATRGDYVAATKQDTDRLRNAYLAGKTHACALALRFVKFNKPLLAAVKAHAAKHNLRPVPPAAGAKRGASADAEGSAPKKAKKA